MDNNKIIQGSKLRYEEPYLETVEFDYSDIIQVSTCTNVICPQGYEDPVEFWNYFEGE